MSASTSLESLRALYIDLQAIADSNLSAPLLDRVGVQLDEHLGDFRKLLDKNARNEQSRQSLATGTLDVSGDQYTINDEFQQNAFKLAGDLNLDEREAAQLFLEAQGETDTTGRPAHTISIIRFHERRKCLLDCLQLLLQLAADVDLDEQLRIGLQEFISRIVQQPGASVRYVQKCLAGMGDVKLLLQGLTDKLNTASVLGQEQQPELIETTEFQRKILTMQHEALGVIIFYLIKQDHSVLADFEQAVDVLKKVDRYDNLLLHHFPALGAGIARFGGSDGGAMAEARQLHEKFFKQPDQNQWALTYVHAAFRAWWLAEYSGWYGENADGSIPENQLKEEATQRATQFADALKDGAFDFLLCVSADTKSPEWHDPARQGLRQWLQRKTPVIMSGAIQFSGPFKDALMEQLENLIEGFITNLPDVLRKLRTDEDEQRQLNKEHDHDLDLERFLVIVSFVFENRPKAAYEAFWGVRDGALLGFLGWASRRASTPLVTAFCEMLQSISENESCASAAHEFLLDEGSQSGKMRRTHSLSWNQIFKELTFFSSKIRDRPALAPTQPYRHGKPPSDFAEVEPESSMMLESYLRLIARLCAESSATRSFLAQHPSFRITDLLFQLASSAIGPRLRACAFTTLGSLLSHKTREAGEYLWSALDVWISGGYAPGFASKTASSTSAASSASAMGAILRGLSSGFEEPNAFVQLLQTLVSPYEDDSSLRDGLSFPENMGITSRMPGIDPYVDFVLGQTFGSRAAELNEVIQQRLLRLSCLDFIATCLDTFNENLVIFASQSNVAVDVAISTSTLENYVLLHPFSRVMEWMFNDKVMIALFATIHQDPAEVASATPDSPLVLSLLQGMHVVTSILDLQPTYLDIIRPLIKSHPTYRRTPVTNAPFTFFEDGVLSHLSVIPDLGQYCGTGHPELVVASLRLLEKISASPRLASVSGNGFSRGTGRNKALAALDDDEEAISKILLREMEADIDINQGPECSEYIVKLRILDFLISCLRATPGRPTIAHVLLGFKCSDLMVTVDTDGSFSRDISLFHTILDMVINFSLVDEFGMASWLVSLSRRGLQVLKELWSSPLTSNLVILQMRSNDTFFMLFAKENVIQPGLLWNGSEMSDPSFASSPSASCLSDFMSRRALILQYLATELRQVTNSHSPSLKQRIFETLMGSTRVEEGQMHPHAAIFDLFDFMEVQFNLMPRSQFSWFIDVAFEACLDDQDDPMSTSNLTKVEQLLVLRRAELTSMGLLEDPQALAMLNHQAQEIIEFTAAENQIKSLYLSRMKVLEAWVQLMLLMLETGDFQKIQKTSVMLRTLQTIMPRLESDLENVLEATELAKLAKSVIFNLDFSTRSFKQDDMGDLVSDRLFHLFQVSLKAINQLGSQTSLKEIFYTISYRYLTGMSDVASISGVKRRHSIHTIKAAGERFIDIICDDAYASGFTCRIAALLTLSALVTMGKQENSKYVVEALTRLNFITILVGSIESIPNDLRDTPHDHVDMTISYCNTRIALLLQISQTRFGAAAVLNAGLFHAIKQSRLFSIDPDLGVDIDGPNAVSKHYSLLVAIMRVVCAALLSRGSQNEHTLDQGRRFLKEYRPTILTVLKKSAGLASGVEVTEQIDELADSFMLLVTFTGFVELDDQALPTRSTFTTFT